MASGSRPGAINIDHSRAIEDAYALSPLQQGMLFNALSEPGSGVDIEQLCCELRESLDVETLQRAWQRVVARHPALRTSLRWQDLAEPLQEVHSQVDLPWEEHDWRKISGSSRDERLAAFLNEDRRRGFDLMRAPLFRLSLLRHGDAAFHLIWTVHHTALEGRSIALVIAEAFAFYEAFCQGRELSPPAPRPFRDYIEWLGRQDPANDEAFWRQTLQGFSAPTPMGVDHAPRADQLSSSRKGSRDVLLSTATTLRLRTLARDNDITLNTLVQGAWALMLYRYSGEQDIVFGVVRANHKSTIDGADAIIGLLVNTLPLRVRVDPDAALVPWLREIRQQWQAMREHDHASLADIQAWSDVPAGAPIFHSTVMFQNYELDAHLRKQGGAWSGREVRLVSQTNYLLDLAAFDGTELRLSIDFDRSRFEDDTVGRMVGHVQTLLEGMASNPTARLGELELLTEAERHELVFEWNRTETSFPDDTLLHELFEEQAERTPDAVAVIFDGKQLTYSELDARSNQLAHCLQKRGVGPDTLVAICVERSLEMVVGILGILKAGGAYVPLEADLPGQRIAFILEETKSPVLLTQHGLLNQLPVDRSRTICLDSDHGAMIATESRTRPPVQATASNLAYVIYTSGSTGKPKGVMISHAAICNHMHWMKRSHASAAGDVELQKSPFGFDASVWEFFAPLMTDASLVVAPPDAHLDPVQLAELIRAHRVSTLQVVPSQLRMLLDEPTFWNRGSPLQRVYCGGEALARDLCEAFNEKLPHATLFNMYGPTEGAIDATAWTCPGKNLPATIPIGKPIDNVRAYIVNRRMQLMPVGAAGELLVGGAGLARGYLNDPGLTAGRFLPDPFRAEPGARVYRTGDLARRLPDGNIEYLGRLDHQVKIRGVRIELGEIETAIAEHDAVREVVVIAHEFAPEDRRLVAYLVTDDTPADLADQLQSLLEARMPRNMVPAYFVTLDSLPLTSAGKVDRTRLPLPHHRPAAEPGDVAPRTPTEKALAAVWREVLQIEEIGVKEDFFDLGGHSLLLVRLISKINLAHHVNLRVSEFLQNPTIEKVARLIDRRPTGSAQPGRAIPLMERPTGLPVYFIYAGPSEFHIASHMGSDHPVFGIEVRWPLAWRNAIAEKRTADYPSMEAMAALYVEAISAHAGPGPCVVAGLSYAGLIAFEAAHQLIGLGHQVQLVILIDSQARPPNPYKLAWQVWRQAWTQSQGRLQVLWHSASWVLGKAMSRLSGLFRSPEADPEMLTGVLDENGVPMPWELFDRLYREIDSNYRLRSVDSRGILLRTAEIEGRQAIAPDETFGWGDLFARGLHVIPLEGEHSAIFGEQIPAIGREIRRVLEQHT